MNRTIRMDRRYTLGDYKYITLEDVVTDIPQDLAFNKDFVSSIRFLQLLSFEITYRRYVKLVNECPQNMNLDEAIAMLESIRLEELEKLKPYLNGKSLQDIKLDEPQGEKENE